MANPEYQAVADKKVLQEGGLLKVQYLQQPRTFNHGAVCSHEGGPLEDGTLEGYEIECPWHGSKFDVRIGC